MLTAKEFEDLGGGYMLILSDDDCRILRETLNISELN